VLYLAKVTGRISGTSATDSKAECDSAVLKLTLSRCSPARSAMAAWGGFGSFPIWPAGQVHPSKAVINGLTHPTLRLFQFCRW
jgi:hypothetical protein